MGNENGKQHILIASAWPYANGSLHLGHIASLIGADVLARYHRLKGDRVLFVSGSDCYGTPIVIESIKQNVSPASIADRYHKEFKKTLVDDIGFTFDLYTKTTTPEHAEVVQEIFLELYNKKHVYTKVGKALYSPFLNRFLPDRFVEGECPHCGYDSARGDQCDECGALLDPLSLRGPRVNANMLNTDASVSDAALEVRESEHFYLKLSAFQEDLERWVESVGGAWSVNAAQFTKSFLKQGMQDRAITRDTDWGVSVPLEGYDSKRLYVWFDAVLGYLSASRHWARMSGDADAWRAWWQSSDAKHYYVHGKDNVPFHTLVLPVVFMALGNLHLPDRVFASEYLTLEGKQFSTSRSWAVWIPDFLQHFDSELLRYFFTAQGPETSDIDFRWSKFGELVNGELIGTFGNLVNRICAFVEKEFPDGVSTHTDLDASSKQLLAAAEQTFESVGVFIEKGKFRQAFRDILRIAELSNQFAHTKEPWKTAERTPQQAQTDLLVLLHVIRSLSVLIQPFLPKTSQKIQSFFTAESIIASEHGVGESSAWRYRTPPSHYKISGVQVLFKKVEERDTEEQYKKLAILP